MREKERMQHSSDMYDPQDKESDIPKPEPPSKPIIGGKKIKRKSKRKSKQKSRRVKDELYVQVFR
jgi:hypothetical protein